jgi:hypothetical protein
MTDYCAFVPFANRLDLLHNVVAAASDLWDDFTIINNTGREIAVKPDTIRVFQPPVPFLFTQSMNFEFEETLRRGKKFLIHMHNDAIIPEGACTALLDHARNIDNLNPRWGVIYTLHDVLCVYNPKVYEDMGGYDTNFAAYFSDNDYFRRMDLAGWERSCSGIEVGHGPDGEGSQTINSDRYLKHVNSVTFPLYRHYYASKWGGVPGSETFTHPFGVLPKEWKLQNLLTNK